jgi:hypothetical protein
MIDRKPSIFVGFENEVVSATLLVDRVGTRKSRRCDECGEVKPGVDLWAENRETGEELWFCEACGD